VVDTRRYVRDSLVLGVLNAGGLVFQVLGQVYTSPAKSAFITSLNTPLTPLCALLVYRELPTRAQRIGVLLASIGLVLLTWPPEGARLNPGDLLTVGCAILYAGFIVESARRTPRHPALSLAFSQVLIAALLFTACAVLTRTSQLPGLADLMRWELRPFPRGPVTVMQMAYMSLVCVAGIMLVQTWALQRLPATTAAVIFALESVVATAIAIAVNGPSEWPGPRGATGGFLVVCAIYVAEGRRRVRSTHEIAISNSHGAKDDAGPGHADA
jgi:drug/metabolite transporter (DMT)-like permease